MKASSRLVSAAFLIVGFAIAMATSAIAQEMQGGMMQRDTTSAAAGSGMPQGGMSRGMMGPRMMQAGMGQNTMCPMMSQGMMGQGMVGSGMTRGGAGALFGTRVTPIMNLSIDDVRSYLGLQLERINNKRLKLGNVSADDGAITAEIVTVDSSQVQRLKIDRHTAAIEYGK